tara:strand:- start:84 stop:407 length:324 start_codon:yes stop_codon:yes gene_type:complete
MNASSFSLGSSSTPFHLHSGFSSMGDHRGDQRRQPGKKQGKHQGGSVIHLELSRPGESGSDALATEMVQPTLTSAERAMRDEPRTALLTHKTKPHETGKTLLGQHTA